MYRPQVSDNPQRACLAIADVSGYTGYLAGVEFDHAQDIPADLIYTVVEALLPFQLSKLEGAAIDGLATWPYGALRIRLCDELVALPDGRTQVIDRAGRADDVGRADPATSAGRHPSEPISASALPGGAS